jgi:mannosyltransferase OCH1-like enzyme
MLQLLTIYNVGEKVRLGKENDGGYVIPYIALKKSHVLFSYGICNDISFDEAYIEATELKNEVHGFDHTIETIQTNYPENFILHLEGLSGTQTENTDNFLAHFDQVNPAGRAFLKIDVEGAEFDFFAHTKAAHLRERITGMVVEFHHLANASYRGKFFSILEKLNECFYICHAHGNNHDTLFDYYKNGEVYSFPNVLELTFIAKDLAEDVSICQSPYPSELDTPNNPDRKEFDLNFLTKPHISTIKTYSDLKNVLLQNEDSIPRFVFRTGRFTLDELPKEVYEYYQSEMANNPGYTLFYFDDADCRQLIADTQNESWVSTYDNLIPPAYKADFWRYVALFQFGGIYLDFSHMALVPFDEIIGIHKELFLKDKTDNHGINNSFIACTSGNKVLCEAIKLCVENVHSKNMGLRIFEITGPQLLDTAFRKVYEVKSEHTFIPLGLHSLILKVIDHNLSQPDKDVAIYDMSDKKIIKYRSFVNHYKWTYNGQYDDLHYSSLYNRGLIYADQKWKDITELYRKHLLREPDFAGLSNYYQRVDSIAEIERSILSSDEYKKINL